MVREAWVVSLKHNFFETGPVNNKWFVDKYIH